MRYWDDKDAHGSKLTDGRICLVIDPEDPTLPTIRTYGRDKEEVLDKIANTAETAQVTIARLRAATPSSPIAALPPSAPVATRRRLTTDEQAQATADLSNPAKSPQALKALLREAGLDVDQLSLNDSVKRVAAIAQEWEKQHPEFPLDDRNNRMLMDKAALMVGFRNITAPALDAAYQDLLAHDMFFEPIAPAAPPDGNPDSRAPRTRNATSYRSQALRTTPPVARTEKPKYTRAQIDNMNSAELRRKIETEPGFVEFYNQEFSAATA